MLITNGTLVTPGLRRRTIQRSVSVGPVSMRFVLIVIVAAAALIALAQSTKWATTSYKEQSLKQELTVKEKEVEEMQFEATRLQSLQAVTGAQAAAAVEPTLQLEQAQKINFLPASSNGSISQLPSDSIVQ